MSYKLFILVSCSCSDGKFITVCEHINLPDDVTMGYVVERLMNINLTQVEQFHSHLESNRLLSVDTLPEQVSTRVTLDWLMVSFIHLFLQVSFGYSNKNSLSSGQKRLTSNDPTGYELRCC